VLVVTRGGAMEAIARPYINVRIRQGVSSIFLTFGLVGPAYDIPATLKRRLPKKREREREREKRKPSINRAVYQLRRHELNRRRFIGGFVLEFLDPSSRSRLFSILGASSTRSLSAKQHATRKDGILLASTEVSSRSSIAVPQSNRGNRASASGISSRH